jgi:1-acyl-sn-glycerol-3-phosphate acyltransferase
MDLLRKIRSAASLALTLFWFVPGAVLMHLVIEPMRRVSPARAQVWAEWFIFGMARMIVGTLSAGGARFHRIGTVPTGAPCLIIGNHQSIVDPAVVISMCGPRVPAFVARSRYRSVPVVGASMRFAGCPIIDPRRDAKGAVSAMAEAGRSLPHGLLVYPEGHRTLDGEVRPFRPAGVIAVLAARRLPVYLVVSDGLWVNRRLVDVVLNVHRMRGTTEALGPFTPPEDEAGIPAFVEEMRGRIVAHLAEMRSRGERAA